MRTLPNILCSALGIWVGWIAVPSAVHAAEVILPVLGTAGPWDETINRNYPYGIVNGNAGPDVHTAPTAFSKGTGIPFEPGDLLTIKYVDGKVGANSDIFGTGANGVNGWSVGCNDKSPSCWTGQPGLLVQLVGAFADDAGLVLGRPFMLGNGPFDVVIPANATQLLLGWNDSWSNDNVDSINISVSEELGPCPFKNTGEQIAVKYQPADLVWPEVVEPPMTKEQLWDLATSMGKSLNDKDLFGWTIFQIGDKWRHLARPIATPSVIGYPAENGAQGICYYVESVKLRYKGSLTTYLGTVGASPACADAVAAHEGVHRTQMGSAQKSGAIDEITSIIATLPNRDHPQFASSIDDADAQVQLALTSIIAEASKAADRFAQDQSDQWDRQDYKNLKKLCPIQGLGSVVRPKGVSASGR